MNCPRCETTTLDERDRDGVTIDVCRTCRGIWLDRGELEKLIARTTAEFDEVDHRPRYVPEPARQRDDDDHRPRYVPEPARRRDDDDHRPRNVPEPGRQRYDDDHRGGVRRKKGWMESLGDIFD